MYRSRASSCASPLSDLALLPYAPFRYRTMLGCDGHKHASRLEGGVSVVPHFRSSNHQAVGLVFFGGILIKGNIGAFCAPSPVIRASGKPAAQNP